MTEYLQTLARGEFLSEEQAAGAMHLIMQGKADPIEIAGLLMGMRSRGESIEELAAFVQVMRTYFIPVQCEDPTAIDVCGTGGDGQNTFNISTAAALVCAGAGVHVAKHGNRSVSSQSGSADVLEALGGNVNITADHAALCLKQTGICFIFARHYHPAMRHVMPVRTTLRTRTAFNILGPLCNPAGVKRQVIGAFDLETAQMIASIMQRLGAEHVLALHSDDGLNVIEVRESGPSRKEFQICPEDYGLERSPLSSLKGGDAQQNASIIRTVLDGHPGPCRDAVVLNSALGIWVSGHYPDIGACIQAAQDSIDSGAARESLQRLSEASHRT